MRSFLSDSFTRAQSLANESEILRIVPEPWNSPAARYLLLFDGIEHFVLTPPGVVKKAVANLPVEVRFPADYLRSADPKLYLKIATLLDPTDLARPYAAFFHPNVDPITGAICLGERFAPGTPLVNLIVHVYDILTYRNFTLVEWNALNGISCRYLREDAEAVSALRTRPLRRTFSLPLSSGTEPVRGQRT